MKQVEGIKLLKLLRGVFLKWGSLNLSWPLQKGGPNVDPTVLQSLLPAEGPQFLGTPPSCSIALISLFCSSLSSEGYLLKNAQAKNL